MFIVVNYAQDVDCPLKLLLVQVILVVSSSNTLRGCCGGLISWKGRRKVGASHRPSVSPVPQAASLVCSAPLVFDPYIPENKICLCLCHLLLLCY